jgi:hypothetical protein
MFAVEPAIDQTKLLLFGTTMVGAFGVVFMAQWFLTQRRQQKRHDEKFRMERTRFRA